MGEKEKKGDEKRKEREGGKVRQTPSGQKTESADRLYECYCCILSAIVLSSTVRL